MSIFEKTLFMNVKDKTIWITGASSGIGAALARAYSKLDAHLIISARNMEALEEVRLSCAYPEKIKILELDLGNNSMLEQKVETAIEYFGHVDILINNAGISQRSLVSETVIEVDRRIFEVNYFGTIALSRAMLPHFKENKSAYLIKTLQLFN